MKAKSPSRKCPLRNPLSRPKKKNLRKLSSKLVQAQERLTVIMDESMEESVKAFVPAPTTQRCAEALAMSHQKNSAVELALSDQKCVNYDEDVKGVKDAIDKLGGVYKLLLAVVNSMKSDET